MSDSLIELVIFLGMGCFVYLFTRASPFRHGEDPASDRRASALDALTALFLGWALISGLFLLVAMLGISGSDLQQFGWWDVVRQIMLDGLFAGPLLIMLRRRHETLSSAGITKQDLGKSALLGILLSALMLLFDTLTKKVVPRSFSLSDFWALITFLVVGIGEEFVFRGYLQTRLIAWLGTAAGWLLASALMAVAHLVQRITIMGMSETNAIVSSLSLLPISLLFGYIMLRTKNIVAGTILHAFLDWSSVLAFT